MTSDLTPPATEEWRWRMIDRALAEVYIPDADAPDVSDAPDDDD